LSHLAGTLFAAAAGGERVFELLEEKPTVADRPGAQKFGRASGAIEVAGVTYAYRGSTEPVLDGLGLEIYPGETVALTGPSGAGKSTVARLLVRFADPDQGTVRLDGHDLRDLTLHSVRANVGYLGQETLLFDTTVRENIAFARPGATQEQIESAARAAGAHDFISELPGGYDGRVGPRGRALSGGQRRRLEIARTLLRDTPVVVLDEPTTGLDRAAVSAVRESLGVLLRGRSALVISHDPEVLRLADRSVPLSPALDGELTEAVV
jgi:ABC-type multidrug transport system fused ATPase/permease subunit